MNGITMQYQLNTLGGARVFKRMENADTLPLMDEIGAHLLFSTMMNFENEQTPEGEPWKQSIRAERDGGKTLQDRGHLRDSHTYIPSSDQVEIGSNWISAAIHHKGGEIRAKNGGKLKFKIGDRWVQTDSVEIPARPALGIGPDDPAEIDDIVQEFYQGVINGH
ncbi:MAG: phage virion morphogenesis protein [Neptuniibacter sp.]